MNLDYDILINRLNLLPENYIPCDLVSVHIPFDAPKDHPKRMLRHEAANAAKSLFCRGKADGMELTGISGYRSYERQAEIFNSSILNKGFNHTRKFIAPPGASEHQTGLALDVSTLEMNLELEEKFDRTKEFLWLVKHAPLYGFILRYPKGREKITGYAYEPWHIRFVTRQLSLYLSKTNLTLEEFYQIN